MIRNLVHPGTCTFWRARVVDDAIVVEAGEVGGATEQTEIDAWADFSMPPEVAIDELAAEMLAQGYEAAPLENVVELIEAGHEVELRGRVRRFFESGEYRRYDGWRCEALRCEVDFTADSVLGNFYQEFYDPATGARPELIPLSAKIIDEIEDEQQWIGFDPTHEDGPIYALYTSDAFEVAYESLDAFLADLRES